LNLSAPGKTNHRPGHCITCSGLNQRRRRTLSTPGGVVLSMSFFPLRVCMAHDGASLLIVVADIPDHPRDIRSLVSSSDSGPERSDGDCFRFRV
jgi:hypothetical protein